MEEVLQKLGQNAGGVPVVVLMGVLALMVVVPVFVLVKMLKARRRKPAEQAPDLRIDILSLPSLPPPLTGPSLRILHVPVRLAVVVLAPVGRIRELPPPDQVAEVIDAIVPGLSRIVSAHCPLIRFWPAQVSIRGFALAFFMHAKLPGDGGKGTPWCSAAGVFKVAGQPMMAGLVMYSQSPTTLGQTIVEREAQWLDLLRIT